MRKNEDSHEYCTILTILFFAQIMYWFFVSPSNCRYVSQPYQKKKKKRNPPHFPPPPDTTLIDNSPFLPSGELTYNLSGLISHVNTKKKLPPPRNQGLKLSGGGGSGSSSSHLVVAAWLAGEYFLATTSGSSWRNTKPCSSAGQSPSLDADASQSSSFNCPGRSNLRLPVVLCTRKLMVSTGSSRSQNACC